MYTYNLDEVSANMVSSVGRKAAYLGDLYHYNINVPEGFVITKSAFQEFLNKIKVKINNELGNVDLTNLNDLNRRFERIKEIIEKEEIPEEIENEIKIKLHGLSSEFFAVRPTVTSSLSGHTFAGEMETYLYISKEDVPHFIKMAWSSYFNPRSLSYRISTGEDPLPAVIVQEMINPRSAGTAFTLHPVTKDPKMIVIESSWGLGEAVTKGIVTPDRFIVPKYQRVVKEKFISDKIVKFVFDDNKRLIRKMEMDEEERKSPSITDDEAVKIANTAIKIEEIFSKPVNIEWAISDNRIYVLEVRGINTVIEET